MDNRQDCAARPSPAPAADRDRPATVADLERLRQQLRAEVRAELQAFLKQSILLVPEPPGPVHRLQLVTLDQCAAMVRRSKRTLEHYLERMPAPRTRGGRGRPSLWAWSEVRPWLTATFGLALPEQHPAG